MSTNILVPTHVYDTYDRTPNVYGYSIIRNMLMIIQNLTYNVLRLRKTKFAFSFSFQLFFKNVLSEFLVWRTKKNKTKKKSRWTRKIKRWVNQVNWSSVINIDLIIKRHGWVRFTSKWVVNLHVNHMFFLVINVNHKLKDLASKSSCICKN